MAGPEHLKEEGNAILSGSGGFFPVASYGVNARHVTPVSQCDSQCFPRGSACPRTYL
jgi:hypothetical protein